VWDFALPEERSLTAFCPVWRGHLDKHYGQQRTAELWQAYLDNLAAHRVGMLAPEGRARVQWDEEGGLAQADFGAVERGLAGFFDRFRLKLTTLADFTLGWGHEPRDNRFGKADEILSPLWSARCENYARALAERLEAGNWRDRVVFSLFDEPRADYYPMIRDAVALMGKADPSWRFTFWGTYAPELEGTIDVWTVPASHYSPSVAARARARGDEVWVYNPPGYCVDATAMALRTNYWWMWREGIPVVFQWTINAWVEWTGSTTLWDPHRNASWVLPGEDGPTNTLRFELTREGLEDFEYLTLLAGLVKTAEAKGRRELAQEGARVLARVDEITRTPADEKVAMLHTQDQRLLHEVRRQAGQAIERLRRELGD